MTGIGVDMVDISRFDISTDRDGRFLSNVFSKKELDYCFSFKNPGIHLAGTFVAKEAVFKALGRDDIILTGIEIRRGKNGCPKVWIKNRLQKSIEVSISHTSKMAIAMALKQ